MDVPLPPPSELEALEREIAQLQAETERLRARKDALTPLSELPPPVTALLSYGPPSTPVLDAAPARTNGGALVALSLGAVVLIAAVASFTGFIWPQLNLAARSAVLVALIGVLAATAVFTKPRLPALAESLAAVSGVSTVVLTTWFYTSSYSKETPLGAGLAVALAAFVVGVGAVSVRFRSWLWVSAASSALASLLITSGVSAHYIPAVALALLLALIAKFSRLEHFVWACAAQCVVALFALSAASHDYNLGYAPPFALLFLVAAFVPVERFAKLSFSKSEIAKLALKAGPDSFSSAVSMAAVLNLALAATATVVFSATTAFSEPSVVSHADAVLSALAAAIFIKQRITEHTSDLALSAVVLAVVGLTANLPIVWLLASGVLLLALSPFAVPSVVAVCAVALTAAGSASGEVIKGDSPTWVVLTVATVLATCSAFRSRRAPLAVLGAAVALLAIGASHVLPDKEVWTLSVAEQFGLTSAVVLAAFFTLGKLRGKETVLSWWLAPAFFAALLPAAVHSLQSSDSQALLRTVAVLALSSLVLARGVALRLGGLVVPAAACIALVAVSRTLDVASAVPVWIPLVLCATVLLALGARFERVLVPSKKLTSWVASLQ